jgi:hypothetical protein
MRSIVDRNVGMRHMTVMGNMMLVNSGFHTGNNLSDNNPQFGYATSELFASHMIDRNRLSF